MNVATGTVGLLSRISDAQRRESVREERRRRLEYDWVQALKTAHFELKGGQNVLKNIQAQLNGTYSVGQPIKITILANEFDGFSSFFPKELAKQLAKFTQTGVEVSLLVPESAQINDWHKRSLEESGVTIVKATKQPGFTDPIDWLCYPPEKLKSGIVIGIGARLGKIALHWKERYQCKSIYIDQGNGLSPNSYKVVETYEDFQDCRKNLPIAANIAVAIGPKTTDDLSASLRSEGKQVFDLTPGIISEFSNLNHATNDGRNCRVLLLGGDNPDNFFKDGLKTAADAVAELKNNSYHLIYVGAGKGTEQQFKDLFHECGVSKSQLRIRNLPKTEDEWKKLFCEVDLAIMPSGDKEFGLEALLALSAGLPVLVHGESGFGEALRDVTFGTSAIVDSDDASEWASRIKKIRETDRKTRLKQAAELRSNYDEKYSWEKQLGPLVAMMFMMVSEDTPDDSQTVVKDVSSFPVRKERQVEKASDVDESVADQQQAEERKPTGFIFASYWRHVNTQCSVHAFYSYDLYTISLIPVS